MKFNLYEVYTQNPKTREGGWNIHFIGAPNREALQTMPLFDEIITCQATEIELDDLGDYTVWNGQEFLNFHHDLAQELMVAGF